MITTLFNSLIALLSLSTAVGVLVHDMHLDTATAAAFAAPTASSDQSKTPLTTDPHTHPERHSFSRLFSQRAPLIQPRANEDKKHLLQKHASRGHHPFDNYNLPLM